jgi:hypothetical protein
MARVPSIGAELGLEFRMIEGIFPILPALIVLAGVGAGLAGSW